MRQLLAAASVAISLAIGLVPIAGCSSESPESLLASARDYLAKRESKAATIQLRNLLQRSPDHGEARFLLGRVLNDDLDPLSAEKELRKALELGYSTDLVSPELARALVEQGQFDKVLSEFGHVRVTSPEANASLQVALGRAYLGLGKVDQATSAFVIALQAKPDSAEALLGQGLVKAGQRDFAGASSLVDKALALAPESAMGKLMKADLLSMQNKPDEAVKTLREVVSANPNLLRARFSMISLLIEKLQFEQAEREMGDLRKIAAGHPQTSYLQALLAVRQKNYAAARDPIQEVLNVAPNHLPSMLLAGNIEYELKSYAQAERHLHKLLQQMPQQLHARKLLAATLLRTGQPSRALEVIQPALKQAPEDSDVLALAGQVFLANNNIEEAGKLFERAAALDPKSAQKRTGLAVSHMAAGDSARAFRELESAAAMDGAQSHADVMLVVGYLQRREFDKAMKAVQNLDKKQPNDPITYQLKAAVQLARNDVVGARASFDQALKIDPTNFAASFNLARLDVRDRKLDSARQRFETILSKDAKNSQAALALAQLLTETGGHPSEIQGVLDRAVLASPELADPRIALISFYLRSGDSKRALAAAQEAQAVLPDNPAVIDALGLAQQAAGELNQAASSFVRLGQLLPESPLPMLRQAGLQTASKDHAGALHTLRRLLAKKPNMIEAQRAVIALEIEAGQFARAIAMAKEVQRQRPQQAVGYLFEGDTYIAQKKWSQAVDAFREGLKKAPVTELASRLHTVLTHAGRSADADKFAADWIKGSPQDLAFRLFLAEQGLRNKQYSLAVQHYKAIVDAQPENPVALNNLAWAMGLTRDPKAVEYAEKANAIQPDAAPILDTLGWLLVEQGNTTRGIELLHKASKIAPQASAIRLNLAKALIKAGQKDAARNELEALANLGDKFAAKDEVAALLKLL